MIGYEEGVLTGVVHRVQKGALTGSFERVIEIEKIAEDEVEGVETK